jgi:hypothetical protein
MEQLTNILQSQQDFYMAQMQQMLTNFASSRADHAQETTINYKVPNTSQRSDTISSIAMQQRAFQQEDSANQAPMMDALAEALRQSNLKPPTLDANDRTSIKRFRKDFEEYKLLGGKFSAGSLLREKIMNTLVVRYQVSENYLRHATAPELFQLLYRQFHATNPFAWEQEFANVKLAESNSYDYGVLRNYIDDFDIAMNFAGSTFAPATKSIVKLFIKNLNDANFEKGVTRQDPKSLEECYRVAETVRSQLAEFVSTSQALASDDLSPRSFKNHELKPNSRIQSHYNEHPVYVPSRESAAEVVPQETRSAKWCNYHHSHSHSDEECNAQKNRSGSSTWTRGHHLNTDNKDNKDKERSSTGNSKPNFTVKKIDINNIKISTGSNSHELFHAVTKVSLPSDPQLDKAQDISALFDTGCSQDCISKTVFDRLKADHAVIETDSFTAVLAYGNKTTNPTVVTRASLMLRVLVGNHMVYLITQAVVIPDLLEDCILGLPTLRANQLLSLMADIQPPQVAASGFENSGFQNSCKDNASNLKEVPLTHEIPAESNDIFQRQDIPEPRTAPIPTKLEFLLSLANKLLLIS